MDRLRGWLFEVATDRPLAQVYFEVLARRSAAKVLTKDGRVGLRSMRGATTHVLG